MWRNVEDGQQVGWECKMKLPRKERPRLRTVFRCVVIPPVSRGVRMPCNEPIWESLEIFMVYPTQKGYFIISRWAHLLERTGYKAIPLHKIRTRTKSLNQSQHRMSSVQNTEFMSQARKVIQGAETSNRHTYLVTNRTRGYDCSEVTYKG